MKNYYKKISVAVVILLSFSFAFPASADPAPTTDTAESFLKTFAKEGAGFKEATEYSASENLGLMVQYVLSFLGVIFSILIIYGGFLWMLARGDEEQVTKAKDIIQNALIGLIIVLAADVITYYLVNRLIIDY